MVGDASAQCADLDEKPEEYECREIWRVAAAKQAPMPRVRACSSVVSLGWQSTLSWCSIGGGISVATDLKGNSPTFPPKGVLIKSKKARICWSGKCALSRH